MNLSLTPEIEKLIQDHIRSGKYESAEHLISAAIISLDQQQALSATDFEFPSDINQKLADGLAAAQAGDLVDGDEFFDRLDREEEKLAKERKTA